MYLTAQHVRDLAGADGWQAYLHLHDIVPHQGFPASAPLSVPEHHPGQMVHYKATLNPGGNAVLSYLDIIAADALWDAPLIGSPSTPRPWWSSSINSLGGLMQGKQLPWTVDLQGVYVVFNGLTILANEAEYQALLSTALSVWNEWKLQAARHTR